MLHRLDARSPCPALLCADAIFCRQGLPKDSGRPCFCYPKREKALVRRIKRDVLLWCWIWAASKNPPHSSIIGGLILSASVMEGR